MRQKFGYWKGFWNDADRKTMRFDILGYEPNNGQWKWSEQRASKAVENYKTYQKEYSKHLTLEEYWEKTEKKLEFIKRNLEGKGKNNGVENWIPPTNGILRNTNWTDLFASKNESIIEGLFDFPKNSEVLKNIFIGSTGDFDLILDFFAGSGTTGDAVMQLNAEDGGNRKFILVQIPEAIDAKKNKAAYDFVKEELKAEPTIFEITQERLKRAAKKINTQLDNKNKEIEVKIKKLQGELQTEETKVEIQTLYEQITQNLKLKPQNCFKVFETMPIWEDYNFEAEEFNPQQTIFDVEKLTEQDIKALLITWKTYDGSALTEGLAQVELSGYTAYYGNGKLYLMHKGFATDNLIALLEKIDSDKQFNPTSIIAFGYHFESKILRELSENVKSYTNKKNIDIDFVTRY